MQLLTDQKLSDYIDERELQVEIESIVCFQSIEAFEEATELVYEDLDDDELFEALAQWHDAGNHDTNIYNAAYVDTPFLGRQHVKGLDTYLLSRYDDGLVIGLARILRTF